MRIKEKWSFLDHRTEQLSFMAQKVYIRWDNAMCRTTKKKRPVETTNGEIDKNKGST
jgi:hypothetical protein